MKFDRRQCVIDFFNGNYSWWEQVYEDRLPRGFFSFEMIRRRQEVLQAAQSILSSGRGLRVLECGCGPGGLLRDLPADQHHVYGLDINLRSLAAVREQSPWSMPVCGDIEQLPFAAASFDMILCVGVLSYLADDEVAVKEMARLLKPGGRLLVANPNLFMIEKLLDPFYLLAWPVQKLWRRLTRSRVERSGFTSGMIRRYRYRQLDRLYHDAGLIKISDLGTSYGPMRFWRRECFSVASSIRISESLVKLSCQRLFRGLIRVANHWVISLEKPARPAVEVLWP